MGRYAEKFTEQQRQAVGSAMIDPHPLTGKTLTAPEAVDRLNAGQLGCPAPAQPMSRTYAYGCRDKERRRRAGHELSPLAKTALEDPTAVRADVIRRAFTLHEYELGKLEAQKAAGKELDPRLYTTWIKNTPTLLALLKPDKPNGKPQPKAKPETTEQLDHVGQLLTAHRSTAGGTHREPAPGELAQRQEQGQEANGMGSASDSGTGTALSRHVPAHA
jgi:hypothetical protein